MAFFFTSKTIHSAVNNTATFVQSNSADWTNHFSSSMSHWHLNDHPNSDLSQSQIYVNFILLHLSYISDEESNQNCHKWDIWFSIHRPSLHNYTTSFSSLPPVTHIGAHLWAILTGRTPMHSIHFHFLFTIFTLHFSSSSWCGHSLPEYCLLWQYQQILIQPPHCNRHSTCYQFQYNQSPHQKNSNSLARFHSHILLPYSMRHGPSI